jgi:hypothetical protein
MTFCPAIVVHTPMSRKKMQQQLFEAEREQRYLKATTKAKASKLPAEGHGIMPFVLKPEEELDTVTGRAGLPLVVETFRAYRGDDLVKLYLKLKKRDRGFTEVEMVEDFLLLLASGGEHLEDFTVLGEDAGLFRLLQREPPSPDAARTFLLRFHDDKLIEAAVQRAKRRNERSYVPEESNALQGLGNVHRELMRRIANPQLGTTATLDHDATVINSRKRTARPHYKGGRGYQPVAVMWTEQDLVVADEFRDGNVPAGKDNLRLIKQAFQALPHWVEELCFRSDSACYEENVLKWLANPERPQGPKGFIGFTISADMSQELCALCKDVLESQSEREPDTPYWQMLDDTRAEETAEWSEVEFAPGDWPKTAAPLRYLVIRFLKRQGGLFSSGERCKFLAVVTNRHGQGDQLIRWHWLKAGSIEHLHDETKNGLGAGILPCAEFGANAAWYRFNMLTYNVLADLKRRVLPPSEQTAKVKRLRFLVFHLAARLTSHARTLYSHLKATALRRVALLEARLELRLLRREQLPGPMVLRLLQQRQEQLPGPSG